MTSSTSNSPEVDFGEEFQISKGWFDRLFPFYMLVTKEGEILQTGEIWGRLGQEFTRGQLDDHFSLKRSKETIKTRLENAKECLDLGLIHKQTGILFKASFYFSKNSERAIAPLKPQIISSDQIDKLHVTLNDFPFFDNTIDSALLVQTQKGLLSENSKLIQALAQEKEKLEKMNANLEDIVESRTRELEESRAMSVHSAKLASLGEMAGGIAHEINNPLAVINVTLRLIRKITSQGEIDREKLEGALQNIESTVERIHKIVTSMRTISNTRHDENFEEICLQDIFDDVFSLCSEKMKNSDVTLELVDSENVLKMSAMCCRVPLSQVFINLVNNAYDAIEELEEKWIKVHISKNEEEFLFRVIDSGSGISEEVEESIFQPFFTTKEIGKGTGIGLSLCKSLIEKQNGTLRYEREHSNTCFLVTLPLQQDETHD